MLGIRWVYHLVNSESKEQKHGQREFVGMNAISGEYGLTKRAEAITSDREENKERIKKLPKKIITKVIKNFLYVTYYLKTQRSSPSLIS